MAKRRRCRNDGSVFRSPSGKYRAQFTIRKGKRISSSFSTKADAQKWLRDQQAKLDGGFNFLGSKITLEKYLAQWLENSKMTLRPKTIFQYEQVAKKHIIPRIGSIPLKDLFLFRLEEYYSELINEGVGARTVRICHSILHRALEKALQYKLVTYNPSQGASLPRYVQTEMHVLDVFQVSQFLVAAQESPYFALYHLAITTGMRQGELFGLKWTDIKWTSGNLHIQRQIQKVPGQKWSFSEPKTKAGKRFIKLADNSLFVLREHQNKQLIVKQELGENWQENDLIFPSKVGSPGDPSNLRIDFNRIIAKAGIDKIRFHDLRHTAASLMLNHKVPVIVVSKILGHSKPSITMDIYGHLYNEMLDEASEIMDKLVTPIQVQFPQSTRIVERK